MKLTILKEKFEEALEVCGKIIQKTTTLPILQNLLFKTEKNFLKISSTNLESGVCSWVLAKVEKEGEFCGPTKPLIQSISFFPKDSAIILEKENNILNLKSKEINLQIVGVESEEFPIIPQPKEEKIIYLPPQPLLESLASIIKIPTISSARPEISGILFSFSGSNLKLVATDSFRLAEKKINLKTSFPEKNSFILPQNSAREIIQIFSKEKEEIKLYLSPNQIWLETYLQEVSHPKIQYTCRLIEGDYPEYEEIIPKNFECQVMIQKEEFLKNLKVAAIFAPKSNEVKLILDPEKNEILIQSEAQGLGKYQGKVKTKIKGKKLEISFNWKFLYDGISEISSSQFSMNFTNQEGPVLIRGEGEDYIYLVMPIKTS